jgi:hypothetical protein
MDATPTAAGKKRGRPPGSANKAGGGSKAAKQQPAAAAAAAAAEAAAGGSPAPKRSRVAKTPAGAVVQLVGAALGLVFQPRSLAAGLAGLEAAPQVAGAAGVLNTFVRPLRRRKGGSGGGGAKKAKSFRTTSIITSLAYSQALTDNLVDVDALPNKGLVVMAAGKAWRDWVATAKPERVQPYVDAAEALW